MSSDSCDNVLKIFIFDVDSYTTRANYSLDKTVSKYRKSKVSTVTVMRLFGCTEQGIKLCLHLHQYFPHITIRQRDIVSIYHSAADKEDRSLLDTFVHDLECEIRKKIDRQDQVDDQFVYAIEPLSSRCLYGFHEDGEPFYRVYFYTIWTVGTAKNILESGHLNNHPIPVYDYFEFTLQFYVENEIYLNQIHLKNVTFRKTEVFERIRRYSDAEDKIRSINCKISLNNLPPTSTCFLECDATVADIVRVSHQKQFPQNECFTPSHPGVIKIWDDQFARKTPEDYAKLVKILDMGVKRLPNPRKKIDFQTKIFQNFLNNETDQSRLLVSPQKSDKNLLNDDSDLEDIDDLEMNLTQRELNISNEDNEEVYFFEEGFSMHSECIPQFDGMDDTGSDHESPLQEISCIFHGKRMKLNLDFLDCPSVQLPRISIQELLKSKQILLGEDLRLKIENQIRPEESKLSGEIIDTSVYSYYSNQGLTLSSPIEQSFVLHSTPSAPRDGRVSKHSLRQSLFNPASSVFTFNLTQNSQESTYGHLNDLNSFISITSKNESYNQLSIKNTNSLRWNRCLEMTLMPLEVHVSTLDRVCPDPSVDSIQFVSFAIYNEIFIDREEKQTLDFTHLGSIIVKPGCLEYSETLQIRGKNVRIDYVPSELELYFKLLSYVHLHDPDLLIGYEVDTLSWGYLLQRSQTLDRDIMVGFSRVHNPYQSKNNSPGCKNEPPQLTGRIVLDLWNILRGELTLRCYTFESVNYHLFRETSVKFSNQDLSKMWNGWEMKRKEFYFLQDYYIHRVTGCVKILVHLNLVRRTFDLSSLYGMRFIDALERGSQFRVESMFLPLVKLENYQAVRFSKRNVASMCSPECIPLVLEPNGSFHPEPVAVLDFQSLYPSVMIAYNYCYSTCLGKVKHITRSNPEFGCYRLDIDKEILQNLKDDIHISPNGVAFVKENVRKGVLPKLLENLLYTRMLIKRELKELRGKDRKSKDLKRKLEVCQLGLKLIANVTYGYTSANYSGRMPCVEVADSIVAKGRETLEHTIHFINEWGVNSGSGAKVIYGDTDSVFVSFPPQTPREKSFEWAATIASEISARNPHPMAIKLEKIYQPCTLLAKKRYCGYAFESATQTEPVFDAKGIETVRRDGCVAAAKILEKGIRILFESNADIDQLKSYIQWQIKKILNGRLSSLNDFIFAKEYFGFGRYLNPSVIPSCVIARKRIQRDPRDEPRVRERVPYVIVAGENEDRLADLVRDPFELLQDGSLRLNLPYYLKRVIFPPLARVLQVITGGSSNAGLTLLLTWYEQVRHFRAKKLTNQVKWGVVRQWSVSACVVCRGKINANTTIRNPQYPLCDKCIGSKQKTTIIVKDHLWTVGMRRMTVIDTCSHCCGDGGHLHTQCITLNCPYRFPYHQTVKDFQHLSMLDRVISDQLQ